MGDHYYRFFPGDYAKDTADLSLAEDGAYRRLLDYYYSGEPLLNEKRRLFRICKTTSLSDRKAVIFVVKKFFTENGSGTLVNKRADREIAERKAFLELQAEKGRKGAAKRWPKNPIAGAMAEGMAQAIPEAWPDDSLPSPSPSLPDSKDLKTRSTPIAENEILTPTPNAPSRAEKPARSAPKYPISWDGEFRGITKDMTTKWAKAYPAVDIIQQLHKMDTWLIGNPTHRKKNYYRFITNWLSRAQEKGGR